MKHKDGRSEARAKLRQRFEIFRGIPFPRATNNDETLHMLHADLVEYDSYVAGRILSLLSGSRVFPHELHSDHQLKVRLERIAQAGDWHTAADAQAYIDYLRQLDAMLELAGIILGKK